MALIERLPDVEGVIVDARRTRCWCRPGSKEPARDARAADRRAVTAASALRLSQPDVDLARTSFPCVMMIQCGHFLLVHVEPLAVVAAHAFAT